MGQYNSAIITNSGLALVASAISGGGTIDFTAVKTSSYAYPEGTNIAGLTDLQDIVQTVEPYSAEVFNETMLQVSALFDNDEVASAYYINTIGLYAKIGSGNPVLFSVCQAATPDQMPQHSDVSPSSFIYNIQTTVQQASQISVSTNPAGTATQQDILRLEEEKVDKDGGPVENTVVTFDDSGEVEGISTFQNFLDTVVSGIKIGTFFKNFVAGAKFILHTGSIINNLTTDDSEKVLSAAMGKNLQDQITQLNSDLGYSIYYPPQPTVDGITFTQWGAFVEKYGKIVILSFNVKGTISKMETGFPLFTLNEGYTPKHFIGVNYVTQYLGVPMLLSIENTGEVSLYAFGESEFEDFFLRQCVAFITA